MREERARTTVQNAVECLKLLQLLYQQACPPCTLITSSFHLPRSLHTFLSIHACLFPHLNLVLSEHPAEDRLPPEDYPGTDVNLMGRRQRILFEAGLLVEGGAAEAMLGQAGAWGVAGGREAARARLLAMI